MVSKIKIFSFLTFGFLVAACQEDPEIPKIEADFAVVTKSPRIFNHVEFDSLPKGVFKYHWDFGNGKTSDQKIPELVIFEEPNKYSVTLTTTTYGGIESTITKEIQIGAYFIKNLKIIPEKELDEKVSNSAKVKLVILQKKGIEYVPVFESMAFETLESMNNPIVLPVNDVGFGGWASSSLGYPVFRLIDVESGEILVDTQYANYGIFHFKSEENKGKSVIYSNIYNPAGFEIEFFYGYSADQ